LTFRFLGIRYAEQPERFTYSTKYAGTGQTNVSATSYGSECVQAGPIGAEDCLFMNIFTPYLPQDSSAPAQKLRPVMFWIHGGGKFRVTSVIRLVNIN
jgi:carboxylesterase type B